MAGYNLPDDVAECKCGNPMPYYADCCDFCESRKPRRDERGRFIGK